MPSKSSDPKTPNEEKNKEKVAAKYQHRNPVIYALSVGILIVIVVTFVAAPIYQPFAEQGLINFGSYDGKEINMKQGNYMAAQYEALKENYRTNSGNPTQAEYQALRAAFDRTVLMTSFLNEAEAIGISASEESVDKSIIDNPRFNDNGKFNKDRYDKTSKLELLNLRDMTRNMLIQDRFMGDLVNAPLVSSKEKTFITDMGRWMRSFEYISFSAADYPDSEAVSFAKTNAKLFRTLDIATLTFNKKADADNWRQQIVDKKTTFEDVAAKHSLDLYKDKAGVRGSVSFHTLQLELVDKAAADAIFALKKGELSTVYSSAQGFVIVRADSEPKDANIAESATVKAIRDYITTYERGKIDDYLNAQAKEFAVKAKTAGFDKAAQPLGKKVQLTASFPINYGGITYPTQYGNFPILAFPATPEYQPISNALEKDTFFEIAFKIKKDEISEPVVLQDQVLVLKLKEEKQATDKDLGMFVNYVPRLISYFVTTDIQAVMVQKEKLVDNFDKTFSKYFVPQN